MPRQLALLLCWIFIGWLFYQDNRKRPNCSRALWIAVIWLMLLGSHPLSFWIGGFGGGGDDLEGNPMDRTFYTLLIFISFVVVNRRGMRWSQLIGNNKWLVIFYLFLLGTMFWSAYPFVTFKRWFKDIGAIFPILIILTEEDPIDAVDAVFTRCAYVLLPLSVVFIKYIPELGRSYTNSGDPMYTGVTTQKNGLGEIVLVFSLVLIWSMLRRYKGGGIRRLMKGDFSWPILVLLQGLWLLNISNSKTALVCLLAGGMILLTPKLPIFKKSPKTTLSFFLIVPPLGFLLNSVFQISATILRLLGRDATLTGRTGIWEVMKEHPVNPIFGCGYLMFWDLNKDIMINGFETDLKTIHNGYMEIYLDGGAIGVTILGLMLLFLGVRVSRALLTGTSYGRLRFAFFIVMVLYNFSESMYARRSPLWFAFLLFCIDGSYGPSIEERETEEKNVEWDFQDIEAVEVG